MDNEKDIKALKRRLSYLEEINRHTVDTLDLAVTLGDSPKSLASYESPEAILQEASTRIGKIVSFQVFSFFLIDEDNAEFRQVFCEPVDQVDRIEKAKEILVEKRIFAWALDRSRPVFFYSDTWNKQLFVHSIATASRIRGMFMGVLTEDVQEIPDSTMRLFSIVMLNIANTLESYELYRMVNNINVELREKVEALAASEKELATHRDKLEELVAARTAELHLANEQLSQEIFERRSAEKELKKARDGLELKVRERTAELLKSNKSLKAEINERRRVQGALVRAKEDWENTFDAIDDLVMLLDADQRIVQVNRAGTEMLGCGKEGVTGRKCYEVFHLQKQPIDNCPLVGVKKQQKPITEEIFDSRFNKTFLCSVAPIFDGQAKISGYVHSLKDVTDFKRLEVLFQKAQKMEALGTLAGGIAHDFNNLLTGIQGNALLMLLDIDKEHPFYDRLKTIEKLTNSGASLTAHLLGYARKGKYEVKPVDLNEILTETVQAFDRTRKEITISLDLTDERLLVEADGGQIEQVLINLFINAADAMPGGGRLEIKTDVTSHETMGGDVYDPEPGNYVRLVVRDYGVGMSEAIRERIFEPFFTTKEMGRGTGLGLASVYGIIKGHKGYIDVQSREGVGTTFRIFLPALKEKDRVSVSASSADDKLPQGSEGILLVDDEGFILEVGKTMLTRMGYKVFVAANGREALDVFRQNRGEISLVILDMIMPDMGGGEVYDRLTEIGGKIKVLLSSGYSIDGQATDILNRGCKGFIQKPFDMAELSGKIREVLDKYS